MKRFNLLFAILLPAMGILAQDSPFRLRLEPVRMDSLAGVQSFVWGQSEDNWVILGGRLDGLHRRQPFASFDVAGQNKSIQVVDHKARRSWSMPLTTLPISIQEQLGSTNMQFYQDDSILYCFGGYGYSATAGDHITYPYITAVNLPAAIRAVKSRSSLKPVFRQQYAPVFAITGGQLEKIDDTWYMVGGQKFDGRYNPMGFSTYVQTYASAIRSFKLSDDGDTIKWSDMKVTKDTVLLHRRDYNMLPQVLPDGSEALTVFSGVFQPQADIPYLNAVEIGSKGYHEVTGFTQYYNHYHCAKTGLYESSTKRMHNIFFGGIAQYYDSAGTLVQNNQVPFVKTIARVTRNQDGSMKEYKMQAEMPGYLGSGAEFIPVEDMQRFDNHVIDLDKLPGDSVVIGYIVGGINSSAPNIFFTNTGTQSTASSTVLKVVLYRHSPAGNDHLNPQSTGSLKLQIYPNPTTGSVNLTFHSASPGNARVTITNAEGKVIHELNYTIQSAGENTLKISTESYDLPELFFVTLTTGDATVTQKIIHKDKHH